MRSWCQPDPWSRHKSKQRNKPVSCLNFHIKSPIPHIQPIGHTVANSSFFLSFLEAAMQEPGQIEDLTDLLAEDWTQMGKVYERWGATRKSSFNRKWSVLGGRNILPYFQRTRPRNGSSRVGDLIITVNCDESILVVTPQGCCLAYDLKFDLAYDV